MIFNPTVSSNSRLKNLAHNTITAKTFQKILKKLKIRAYETSSLYM